MFKRFLFWFAHENVEFRHEEINSIVNMFHIPLLWVEKASLEKPYWIVDLPSEEDALKIATRSISVRNYIELWGRSNSIAGLHENLKRSLVNLSNEWDKIMDGCNPEGSAELICPRSLMEEYFKPNLTFKITVETFCRHFSLKEKITKIESFSYLPMEGSIQLKDPDVELIYIEFYGVDPNNIPDAPCHVFLGRRIADGQRNMISKLSLRTRKFIANTSMDPQLSLLMSNQAQVRTGDIVFDPFVGSGSLLVAAAEFGGYVLGSDIDFMLVHARTRPTRVTQKLREDDESVRANMVQYKTEAQYLDVVVSDFSLPIWRDNIKFDAIITDPPYGIRESTEKIGIDKENYTLSKEYLSTHIPSKVDYQLNQIYYDLLNFAVKHLQLNRRLVCWFPLCREDYKECNLPSHDCLKLIANSEQILNKTMSRRLLTYEKIGEPVPNCDEKRKKNNYINDIQKLPQLEVRQKYFNPSELTRKERKLIEKQSNTEK